jgi:hypothetical protein
MREDDVQEEAKIRFGHDPTDPWAVVIHSSNTAINLATVVRAIGFPVVTDVAKQR